eukprot:Opistho-2@15183
MAVSGTSAEGEALFLELYTIGPKLGEGAFAVVKKCISNTTGLVRAVKIINKKILTDQSQLEHEVHFLSQFKHKHIVELFETYNSPDRMLLVMEFVSGGEMFDRIVEKGWFPETDAAKAMGQICDALAFLHKKSIMHRDIKPENILYAHPGPDADIKLADFGLAKALESGTSARNTMCGTPGYIAPEILLSKPYGTPVDMFAVGSILYLMLSGSEPFYDETDMGVFERIAACSYSMDYPEWEAVSDNAKDLVSRLLVFHPEDRLSAEDVLRHPWIQELAPGAEIEPRKLERSMSIKQEKLKTWNARRKWKASLKAVRAVARMGRGSLW